MACETEGCQECGRRRAKREGEEGGDEVRHMKIMWGGMVAEKMKQFQRNAAEIPRWGGHG